MSGEFEPNDSRNVTGTASTPDGRWTAEGQQPPLANGETPKPTGHQGREPHEGWSSQGQATAQGGGGMGGGGGLSQGDEDEQIGSEDVDGEEGVQFHPDQELIRKVGEDGGAGGLSNEGEGEDMENRNMGSESGAGANTFTGPSGGAAGNSQAGFGTQNSGTEDAQAQAGQLNTNPAQAEMGQAIDGGWPDQMQQSGQEMGQAGSLGEQIREHMSVVDAEGNQVGTVDSFENDQIKLTRNGSSDGQHHYLPIDRVAGIEGDQIRLHDSGENAFGSNGS